MAEIRSLPIRLEPEIVFCVFPVFPALEPWPCSVCPITGALNPFSGAQARLDGAAVAFFALSTVMFIYVGWGSCVNYLQSWLGALTRPS
jgi:hypothetical protein